MNCVGMNPEVQLLKEVQNVIYEDAETNFYFDWTYARMDAMKMERDGAEKSSKQECELFLHTS